MYEFYPYFTNDGSVGLYNPEYEDIYHSATGALTEAYEKFILPSNIDYLLSSKKEIKLLDICYGIGYNTKSFLNYILKNKSKFNLRNNKTVEAIYTDKNTKQNSNEEIYTNNICKTNTRKTIRSIYADKISHIKKQNTAAVDVDNIYPKISVTALDIDKNLLFLSPFIRTGVRNFEKYNVNIPHKKILKYLDKNSKSKIEKIDDVINFILLDKIFSAFPESCDEQAILPILKDKNYQVFFGSNIRAIFEYYKTDRYLNISLRTLSAFLHNIYYHHISSSYKNRLKSSILRDFSFDINIGDARDFIKNDKKLYNLIFLDAFTPSKCPCLWSYEFFNELFRLLEPDGMLLTYSSSSAIRSAMLEAGFVIGSLYPEGSNNIKGTVAVKQQQFITNPLSKYELGLLNTKSGIFYRDKTLSLSNEEIIKVRNFEIMKSDRLSATEYKKLFL